MTEGVWARGGKMGWCKKGAKEGDKLRKGRLKGGRRDMERRRGSPNWQP